MSAQRPDPKNRGRVQIGRTQLIQKFLSQGREKRLNTMAKFRVLSGDERKHAIQNWIMEDTLTSDEDDKGHVPNESNVPSYNTVYIQNLDWDEFLSTEEYLDLYNDIESALLSEEAAEDHSYVADYDTANDIYIPEEGDTQLDSVLCPLCFQSIMQFERNCLSCPTCSNAICLTSQYLNRCLTPTEFKQQLSLTYDQYSIHLQAHHITEGVATTNEGFQGLKFNKHNNGICAICSYCGITNMVI